jgi:hypothetical protein
MTVGLASFVVGLLQGMVGCIFFRKPGASPLLGAIWHAQKYLTQSGVALWMGAHCLG